MRVLDALREADIIEAEDTRVTRRLLARYEIPTPLEPYHAKNLDRRTKQVLDRIAAGDTVALVSDAGTPGVSDPGARLVEECLDAGLPVDVLPGPSAIVTALVASGLPTHAFYFGGFLPRKAGERARRLRRLADLDATLLFYESPGRTAATLATLAEAFPGRSGAMARELTKIHQEVDRGTLDELAARMAQRELKGEVVLLVGPPAERSPRPAFDAVELRARVAELVSAGRSRRDAVRAVADESGVPRNDVYQASLRSGV